MTGYAELPVSVPTLHATRWTSEELHVGMKEHFYVARVERGLLEWWGGGKTWQSAPGCIVLKQPGDVHRDLSRDGPTTWTIVALPADDIARVRQEGKHFALQHLEPDDERAAPFHRLHDAICAGAGRLSLEVALAEAVSAFSVVSTASFDHTRPVRRVMEYLRERLAESISLDELAQHARLDKFHLCRAFRTQIGLPPHAYLTHLRVARAKTLLLRGVRACDVASLVGLYDQAQLTRHFRRIVGTTPARWAKERGQRAGAVVSSRHSKSCIDCESAYHT